MWNEFNIKTFPAETAVFRDGVFCPELSTLNGTDILTRYDLPVHIIFIGEIAGKCRLNINIVAENQPVFLSVRVNNKKPAFLNIFIKNAGKNSELRGHVLMENSDNLTYDCTAQHLTENTGILIQNRLIGREKSISKLSGRAIIEAGCDGCTSDVGFRAMCESGARVEFRPAQYIRAVPNTADHGAAIHNATDDQILYLRQAGLSGVEVNAAIRDAFVNDFTLF